LIATTHPTTIQISLDLTDMAEALETARIAVEAGVDWLEAGTPLLLAEGLKSVRALRAAFPDHLACEDKVAASRMMEDIGVDYIVHHTGYDERNGARAAGRRRLSPLDELDSVVKAVRIPVQAVGGLTIEEAIEMPRRGAPLVVIGAPLAIDADSFNVAGGDLKGLLTEITRRIRE
jgi:3-hexulose-6-phosphate synthase